MATEIESKDAQAELLARTHYGAEEGLTHVIRYMQAAEIEEQNSEPIKLLEVNVNTVSTGIMPIQFAPSPEVGITYPTTIIEVTPEEFERIEKNELVLPPGWLSAMPIANPLA